MKKSILALVMALILCFGIAPAGVMAAEYSGDAFTPAESTDQKDPVDVSDASVEDIAAPAEEAAPTEGPAAPADKAAPTEEPAAPADKAAPTEGPAAPADKAAPTEEPAAPAEEAAPTEDSAAPADGAAFKPYVFEIDEEGEKALVEMEPGLMDISPEEAKTVPEDEQQGADGKEKIMYEVLPAEFTVDSVRFNDTDVIFDLSWTYQQMITNYKLQMFLLNGSSAVNISQTRNVIRNDITPFENDVVFIRENDSSFLYNLSVQRLGQDETQFEQVGNDLVAKGVKNGDQLCFRLIPVLPGADAITPESPAKEVTVNINLEDPPEVEDCAYNKNDTVVLLFKTTDLASKQYEVLGLVKEDPGDGAAQITIGEEVYYIFGKKTVDRSNAQIENITDPPGILKNRVKIKELLDYTVSKPPAIGSDIYYVVRTENSELSTPFKTMVTCDVPMLERASFNSELNKSTVIFKTEDVKAPDYEVYGFIKDKSGIPIGNNTYKMFSIMTVPRENVTIIENSTNYKGNPMNKVQITTPLSYLENPPAVGTIVYFAAGTWQGIDPVKYIDMEKGFDLSNLVETVVGPVNIGFNSTVKLNPESSTYNGSSIEPEVKIICNGRSLVQGIDFNVTFRNNINAGTAAVSILGQGSYTGGINQTFPIAQKSLKKAEITLAGTKYTYNGKAQKPAVKSVKVDGRTLKEGADFTVTYKNNVNAGTASVTITGKGNYKDSATKQFTIEKGTPVITATNFSKYAKKTDNTFDLGAKTNVGKLSYSSSTKNVKVSSDGKATVKAHFLGKAVITLTTAETANYKSVSKKMVITVKPSKIALISVENYKETPAGSVKVKWKRTSITTATGYQVRYSTSKDFTPETTKRVTIVGRNKNNKVITGLKKNTTYYFQVRTYRKTSTGYYYSGWSNNCLSIKTLKK